MLQLSSFDTSSPQIHYQSRNFPECSDHRELFRHRHLEQEDQLVDALAEGPAEPQVVLDLGVVQGDRGLEFGVSLLECRVGVFLLLFGFFDFTKLFFL